MASAEYCCSQQTGLIFLTVLRPALAPLLTASTPGCRCAGNIARTCAATAVALHLVEPLGFELNDAKLKRAGLDYWKSVFVQKHASWQV